MHSFMELAHHARHWHELDDLEGLMGTRVLFTLSAPFRSCTPCKQAAEIAISDKRISHRSGIWKSVSNPDAPRSRGDSTARTLAISQGLSQFQQMRREFIRIALLSRISPTKWLHLLASKKTRCPQSPVSQKVSFRSLCRWRAALRFFVRAWAQLGACGEAGCSAFPRAAVHRGGSQPPRGRASAEYFPEQARDLRPRFSCHVSHPAYWHPSFIVILSAHSRSFEPYRVPLNFNHEEFSYER